MLTASSAVLVLALVGCGGSEGETETRVSGPTIERATAERLADLSDELSRSLDDGDPCAATEAAARLREDVTAAINDGKVPPVYLEELSGLANELVEQVPDCVEPTTTEDDDDGGGDEGEDDERRKKKQKDKKQDDDGSEPADTGTVPTETETPTTVETTTETTETTTESTTTTTTPEGDG